MDLRLKGRSAVVTGASKGIGLAITRALADEGVSVVAGALRGSPELDELTTSAEVHFVSVDLTTNPDLPGDVLPKARIGRNTKKGVQLDGHTLDPSRQP